MNSSLLKHELQFNVDLDVLLEFIFPGHLQHPLSTSRLIIYSLYGPLDNNQQIHSGPQGRHILSTWELDSLCVGIEKEDIIKVYLHNADEMGILSSEEQEAILSQADAHLKRAPGKALLPQISKEEVIDLFKNLPRNDANHLSFHDIQHAVHEYRRNRINNYKKVFPRLTKIGPVIKANPKIQNDKLHQTVTTRVAPTVMFQRNKGASNPDIVVQTSKYLNKHSYKICELNEANSPSITTNVRLLREVEPKCPSPYVDDENNPTRPDWNGTVLLKGTGMGSMVNAIPSKTTWKRNTTIY